MTLPLELIAGYAAGSVYALAAAEPLAQTSYPTRTRYFAATAIFAGGALVPAGCALYGLYPDWSLMYLANPAQLPILLMLPLVIATCFSAPLIGFLVSHRMIAAHRAKSVRNTLIGVGVLALLVTILGRSRLASLGHYEAFHYGGELVPLLRSHAVVVLAIIVPALIAAFVFTHRQLRSHIRAIADVAEGVPVRAGERR